MKEKEKIGKAITYRLHNRRIQIGIGSTISGEYAIYLNFKKLIKYEEIEEYKKQPTVAMVFKKNIVISQVCISYEAAYGLYKIFEEIFKETK